MWKSMCLSPKILQDSLVLLQQTNVAALLEVES